MDHVSVFVAHDLGLDVPRLEHQLLDEDAAVAESLLSLRPVRVEKNYFLYFRDLHFPKKIKNVSSAKLLTFNLALLRSCLSGALIPKVALSIFHNKYTFLDAKRVLFLFSSTSQTAHFLRCSPQRWQAQLGFSYLLCRDRELNSPQFSCTPF